ncbi:MAG: class II aldolase/adducin family protein [Lachnospiraceae bacterium]|nr:class II aldolase/adducin family protein [Lachnospiraceae bacterium]
MEQKLEQKLNDTVWVCHSLFDRNKTSGSSANISFLHGGKMYISMSGSCFGTLTPNQFAVMTMDGACIGDKKPSKEWPLHLKLYQNKPETGAVIHTHGTYAVLWSFVPAENEDDCIPAHTPYLNMKLGKVCTVPYEKPGSQALFDAFDARIMHGDGYLLKQHGAVVPGSDVLDAFYCLEELEESARVAWELRAAGLR